MFDMLLGVLGITALFIFYIVVVLYFIDSVLGLIYTIITFLLKDKE